ncbi:hypothetical protein O0I10_013236 [Lichtheimia ornata]|uniref:Uncharacterized protein n=1 Tax=Lichtheimia ornata TaxID=688661 RepID=A0AAD7UQI5_9FUNG|nr:uncharacterized protein O0I10_013236 [Lichtheimia ornata]KAJ8651280.1 hypothetical protein O0I10_013236 [Lichtheimia ornata]
MQLIPVHTVSHLDLDTVHNPTILCTARVACRHGIPKLFIADDSSNIKVFAVANDNSDIPQLGEWTLPTPMEQIYVCQTECCVVDTGDLRAIRSCCEASIIQYRYIADLHKARSCVTTWILVDPTQPPESFLKHLDLSKDRLTLLFGHENGDLSGSTAQGQDTNLQLYLKNLLFLLFIFYI